MKQMKRKLNTDLDHRAIPVEKTSSAEYNAYFKRWFMLSTLSVLNLSNAVQWILFAPVAYIAAEFYGKDVSAINMLSVIFMISTLVCGVFVAWILDTYGLKLCIIGSAWLNFSGGVLRVISACPGLPETARTPLLFIGTSVAALAQPVALFAPTKLAAVWFPENERATANMIASIFNNIGVMLPGILSPLLAPNKDKILFMLCIEGIPTVLAVLMATLGVRNPAPPTPPSASAESHSEPFLNDVRSLVKNKAYWLLVWIISGGNGIYCALMTLLGQMLCLWGYHETYAGALSTAIIVSGVIGSAVAAVLVDRTKRFTELIKGCCVAAILSLIAFSVIHNRSNAAVPIAISLGAFGLFGMPMYPIGCELAVEATYPVGEGTSSGLLIIIGQLQGILLVVILSALGRDVSSDYTDNTCSNAEGKVYDMTVPTYVMTGYAVLAALVFVLTFQTKYRRLEADQMNDTRKNSDCEFEKLNSEGISEINHKTVF